MCITQNARLSVNNPLTYPHVRVKLCTNGRKRSLYRKEMEVHTMTIYYNTQDRKPLVKAISEFTGADAVYMLSLIHI